MTSLGEKLRAAREEKDLSIDTVARDTNIARRYLVAFEAEDFIQFPSETHAKGFMRTYSEYLGLDSNEMLSLYKLVKIQETPTPIKELLTDSSGPPKALPFIVIFIILLGGAGAYFFLNWNKPESVVEPAVHVVANYTLEQGVLEQRFYAGDSLTVPANGDFYKFTLANFGEVVTIDTPAGPLILDLSQTVSVDINNDGANELKISLEDYSRTDSLMGAWIRFELEGETTGEAVAVAENTVTTNANTATAAARTVFSGAAPYPFTLQAEFQGFCMFRWQILREANRPGRTEQYFARGNELSITAQNGVRLWASNASAVKLQAIGSGRTQAVEIGGSGEVVVVDIAWQRDETSGWKLAVVRLEN
jgi:cytoskeletal protein RodZ